MEKRKVDLIGVASGLGGAEAACAQAPARLAAAGLEDYLRGHRIDAAWAAMLVPRRGRGVPGAVARLCGDLAAEVGRSTNGGRLPCVIGGDHSCAVGTWSGAAHALQARGRIGLVWLDAHMDSHTPGSSPSGRLHGMPLAVLLGQGDDPLDQLQDGALAAGNVALVGVRSYEQTEAELLDRLGVRVFDIGEVQRRGMAAVMDEAIAIATAGTAAFGVTLDLDALDPRDAPAVATPAAFGLPAEDTIGALCRAGADPRLAAVELAEYCPRLDRDGRTERLVLRLLAALLGGTAEQAQVAA